MPPISKLYFMINIEIKVIYYNNILIKKHVTGMRINPEIPG